MSSAKPISASTHAQRVAFDAKRAPKPIDQWETLDLLPFTCPHQLAWCLREVSDDNFYIIHFEHRLVIQLMAHSPRQSNDLHISVEATPTPHTKPPYNVASIVMNFSEYGDLTTPLRQFNFVMQLNAHILRAATSVANKDTFLVRGADGRLAENPKSYGNVMPQLLNPPAKKPWWHF